MTERWSTSLRWQDEITERVVATIEPELYAAQNVRSQRKPPESLDAWECVIRALSRGALEYRRAYRVPTASGMTESYSERAAVGAAIRRYQELDPTARSNRHDAVAVALEMVGNARTSVGSGAALTPNGARS
jgi:hypothetical protein